MHKCVLLVSWHAQRSYPDFVLGIQALHRCPLWRKYSNGLRPGKLCGDVPHHLCRRLYLRLVRLVAKLGCWEIGSWCISLNRYLFFVYHK